MVTEGVVRLLGPEVPTAALVRSRLATYGRRSGVPIMHSRSPDGPVSREPALDGSPVGALARLVSGPAPEDDGVNGSYQAADDQSDAY